MDQEPCFQPKRDTMRLAGLDALRGIAALCVVLYHFTWFYGNKLNANFVLSFSFPLGHYGVDLFFVISGFVIFMTLERSVRVRSFAVARFARLYPAFWTAVVIALVARALDGRLTMSLGAVLANFTMLPSLFGAPFVDGVYWTLFYELFFYVLVAGFFACGGKQVEIACLLWLLVSVIVLGHAPSLLNITVAPFSYLFVTGIMLYRLQQNPKNLPSYAVLLTALFFAFQIRFSAGDHISGITNGTLTVMFAIAVWGARRFRVSGTLGFPLVFLGEISYSLYLVHSEVGYSLLHLGTIIGLSDDLSFSLALAIVIAIAWVMNKHIERPVQQGIKNLYVRLSDGPRTLVSAQT